jgi:two-component system phosphate regulon response regulator PhoB
MAKEKILVVDDEEDILELIRVNLSREGYNIRCTGTGESAIKTIKTEPVDLIVLDLMLPGIDGFTVAQRIKDDPRVQHIPIIMLTAKGSESDVVAGLEIGAEDYITKPFSPRILLARIHTVLRRRNSGKSANNTTCIEHQDIRIDIRKHELLVKHRKIDLTYTEFEVLTLLASRPGWAFTRSQIVDKVRGYNYSVTDRSVDVQIVGLRRKLGPCGHYIETVRGVGYRFKDTRPPKDKGGPSRSQTQHYYSGNGN